MAGKQGYSGKDYLGLALSFGITMLVNIAIMSFVGHWLDGKLGTPNIFWLGGVLIGICSGFRLFIEQVERLEHPIDPDDRAPDDW